jgi:hypothetical protein
MTRTLTLGVDDVPYPDSENGHKLKTTGDVAELLEDKYHIMEHFIDQHADDVIEKLKDAEEVKFSSRIGRDLRDEITYNLEVDFRNFILNSEMDKLGVPGVPTEAARKGRKTARRIWRGPERPSFYDTELYLDSFNAEIK